MSFGQKCLLFGLRPQKSSILWECETLKIHISKTKSPIKILIATFCLEFFQVPLHIKYCAIINHKTK